MQSSAMPSPLLPWVSAGRHTPFVKPENKIEAEPQDEREELEKH